VLSVDIDEKGAVIGVEVLEGAGGTADAEAIARVRTSTFPPTIYKGKPVRSRITVRYP
jgi:TonB family protein